MWFLLIFVWVVGALPAAEGLKYRIKHDCNGERPPGMVSAAAIGLWPVWAVYDAAYGATSNGHHVPTFKCTTGKGTG